MRCDISGVVDTRLSRPSWNKFMESYEQCGPCPFGCGATDAFHVYPDLNYVEGIGALGLYLCMDTQRGGRNGCGQSGDSISYLEQTRGMKFREACEHLDINPDELLAARNAQKDGSTPVTRPARKIEKPHADSTQVWQENAANLARYAHTQLTGEPLDYLHDRGLTDETIDASWLGYYPSYKRVDSKLWGFPNSFSMLIPRGIVIPWPDRHGNIICVRFRRLPDDESEEAKQFYGVDEKTGKINRYRALRGSSSHHLYGVRHVKPDCNLVFLEGELDAIVTQQSVRDLAVCVASGSTSWARSDANVRLLAACQQVLLCHDTDSNHAGDRASQWWIDQLCNVKRWRPAWGDANSLYTDGANLREWVSIGLGACDIGETSEDETPLHCCQCGLSIETPEHDFHYAEDGTLYCDVHFSQIDGSITMSHEQFMHRVEAIASVIPGCIIHTDMPVQEPEPRDITPEIFWQRLRVNLKRQSYYEMVARDESEIAERVAAYNRLYHPHKVGAA